MRYDWGINGRSYDPDKPLVIGEGERVRLTFVNRTLMWHPMHVHGHTFPVGGDRVPEGHRRRAAAPDGHLRPVGRQPRTVDGALPQRVAKSNAVVSAACASQSASSSASHAHSNSSPAATGTSASGSSGLTRMSSAGGSPGHLRLAEAGPAGGALGEGVVLAGPARRSGGGSGLVGEDRR